MTRHDDSEQLAWDFDASEMGGDTGSASTAVVPGGGVSSYAPGSERCDRRIAANRCRRHAVDPT